MLFKLSCKNIQKSIKDYAIYFFTLILGVAIFYVFNSLDSQTIMIDVSKNTKEIIKMMIAMLSGVSVFVSFILGFLIIFANKFLIKKRSKEFAVYLTLGMSKRKISILLFIETLIIGSISLIVGLFLGTIASQFMSIIVANMFQADMSKFEFVFSTSAFLKTLIYFAIIYFLVMGFNTISISKTKLINLLNNSKKSETVKLKNSLLCTIVFLMFASVLAFLYYRVTAGFDKITEVTELFGIIILGCVSTFFIFWSLSGLILKIMMSFKKTYYKNLNSFVLRQISSKINTTVFSMTIISLMLFITITLLSSALSLNSSLTKDLNKNVPVDIQITKGHKFILNMDVSGILKEDALLSMKETFENNNFDYSELLEKQISINTYSDSNFTLGNSLGNKVEDIITKFQYIYIDREERIMKLSDYNKVAKLYGHETLSLNNDEYIILADQKDMVEIRNVALKENTQVVVFGKSLKPKYKECKNGFIDLSPNAMNTGIIIVDDSIIDEKELSENIIFGNYKNDKKEIEEKFNKFFDENYNITTLASFNTKIDITEAGVGLGTLITFISIYIGIVFLISCTAILSLKELSEATENKDRYKVLRKIGVDEKMLNKALFKQIGIFFLFPLIIAIIHSVFGIMFAINMLEVFGTTGLLNSIIMTFILLIFIYGGYFLITYLCSKSIIKD